VPGDIHLTVLVENEVAERGLIPEHGLAVWIESDAGRLLFDTGQGEALGPNAERLGVDLSTVDAIALSHGHYDHTGGLAAVLRAAPNAAVYAHPAALGPEYAHDTADHRTLAMPPTADEVVQKNKPRFIATKQPTEVFGGFHVTGEVPRRTAFEDVGSAFPDDQALFFSTAEGIVLLVGCAHAGIVNTMRYVAELTGTKTLYCVMGGMHLIAASDERIAKTIEAFKELDVKRAGPVHCTGEKAVARFRKAFPKEFFPCPAGTRLPFRK